MRRYLGRPSRHLRRYAAISREAFRNPPAVCGDTSEVFPIPPAVCGDTSGGLPDASRRQGSLRRDAAIPHLRRGAGTRTLAARWRRIPETDAPRRCCRRPVPGRLLLDERALEHVCPGVPMRGAALKPRPSSSARKSASICGLPQIIARSCCGVERLAGPAAPSSARWPSGRSCGRAGRRRCANGSRRHRRVVVQLARRSVRRGIRGAAVRCRCSRGRPGRRAWRTPWDRTTRSKRS